MEIKEIPKAIQILIDSGKLTEEDYRKAESTLIADSIVDVIHTLFCEHTDCKFPVLQEDVDKWRKITIRMTELFDLPNDLNTAIILTEGSKINTIYLAYLLSNKDARQKFISDLLSELP